MTALGPLLVTSLFAAVSPVLFLAVIAVLVMRGRDRDERPGPMPYFLHGVALACIIVGVFGAAVTVHSVASLVGPTPNSSGAISSSGSSGIRQSTSGTVPGSFSAPDNSFSSNSGTDNSFTSFQPDTSAARNQNVSDSVTAGLFLVVALIGLRLVWPRALREVGDRAAADLALRYSYFVAGLTALALLVMVPLTADNVFRAIAPGVAAASGHADGVRNLVTFGVVSALLAVILRYHLRYANQFRSGAVPPTGDNRPPPADGDYFQLP